MGIMSEPFQPPSPLAHTPRLTSASGPGAPTDLPTDLTQLLATARASRATAVAQLLQQAEQTSNAARTTVGVEHLLFVCANIPCAVPLTDLREALPTLPQTTPLPFSAPWLLGIFPLRTEVIGLADPIPLLLGRVRPIPGNAIEWATWSANQPWALQADAALAAVGALAEPWRWGAWLHGEGVDVFAARRATTIWVADALANRRPTATGVGQLLGDADVGSNVAPRTNIGGTRPRHLR